MTSSVSAYALYHHKTVHILHLLGSCKCISLFWALEKTKINATGNVVKKLSGNENPKVSLWEGIKHAQQHWFFYNWCIVSHGTGQSYCANWSSVVTVTDTISSMFLFLYKNALGQSRHLFLKQRSLNFSQFRLKNIVMK